ncbi:MAG: hypothetical protein DSY40_01770, partial [Nautilia sp.]
MFFLGVLFAIIAGIVDIYVLNMDVSFVYQYIPKEYANFVVSGSVIFVFFLLYYFFLWNNSKNLKVETKKIKEILNNKELLENKQRFFVLKDLFETIKKFIEQEESEKEKLNGEKEELIIKLNDYQNIIENGNLSILTIHKDFKVVNLNSIAKEEFKVTTSFEFNQKFRSLKAIIENLKIKSIDGVLNQEFGVKILGKYYSMYILKSEKDEFYIARLLNVTSYEDRIEELEKRLTQISEHLFTEEKMDKFTKTTFIRIVNYDKYAGYLNEDVLKEFENKFVKVLVSNGYKEVFKIDKDLYAVYNYVDVNKMKIELENLITIEANETEYMIAPIVIFGLGTNYQIAKEQVLESSIDLQSNIKESPKYTEEFIKKINTAIANDEIYLLYRQVKDIIMVEPYFKLDLSYSDRKLIPEYLKSFNLYLIVMEKLFIKYGDVIKRHKVLVNLDSYDLSATSQLTYFMRYVRKEQLDIILNIYVNDYYKLSYKFMRELKKYFYISLRNVGKSYFD